jgi:hypothetical protein
MDTPQPEPLDFLVREIASPRNRQYIHRLEPFALDVVEKSFVLLHMNDFLDELVYGLSFRENMPGDHIQWFSHEKLGRMLVTAGFTIIHSKYGGSVLPEMQNRILFDTTTPQQALYIDAIKE